MSYESILASHNERLQYLIDNPEPVDLLAQIIEGSVTEISLDVETVGYSAFRACSALTTAYFPATISIDEQAFRECSALTTVYFPAVTSMAYGVFYSCTSLTTVDLPAAASIDEATFFGCSALATLILRSSTVCALSRTDAFTNTPISSGSGYIYVPSALVDSYKAATNWSAYAAQFRAIEDYPDICGG